MAYREDTVVAEIINADPSVVARLIALNPAFEKINNPIFRKTIARFVTLGDVAKVSGVPLEKVLAAANDGLVPAAAPDPAPAALPPDEPPWLAGIDAAGAVRLDVRPLLQRGEEPLGVIMRAAGPMAAGQVLILDAPFDPAPLRRILAGKGFLSHPVCLSADHWQVTFLRQEHSEPNAADGPAGKRAGNEWTWREADGVHIDVRGLEPPEPMVAVLALTDAPETGDTIIVHHEREPVFLYPELEERGWTHRIIDGESGEVRLQLTKAAS